MNESRLPTTGQIQQRAYKLYLECGCEDGHDVEDWLAAEKELTELSEESASSTPRARSASVGQESTSPSADRVPATQALNRSKRAGS